MIKIRVPATSANLGPGFDTLGIALSLYNTYTFELSDEYQLVGFKKKYTNENNLCLKAYKEVFKILNKEEIKVKITIEQNIPNSGGLGSSANVIIAGVVGANMMLGDILSKEEMINIACMIEGHPDNVIPAFVGSLVSSVKLDDGKCLYFKYSVSDKFLFNVLVPPFSLSTEKMRKCLPVKISYKDAIFNLSRAINVPYALNNSDISILKELMRDKMHQDYRVKYIDNAIDVFNWCEDNNCVGLISGSGASLLVISDREIENDFKGFKLIKLKVDCDGVKVW